MAVTNAIFAKLKNADAITRHEQLFLSHTTSVGDKQKQTKYGLFWSYQILCPLCHLYQRNNIKKKFMQFRIYFNVACQVHIAKKGFYKK